MDKNFIEIQNKTKEIIKDTDEKLKEFPDKLEQYVIWNPKGSTPSKIHEGIESAEKEAERLAIKNTGYDFYILKVVKKAKIEVKIVWE